MYAAKITCERAGSPFRVLYLRRAHYHNSRIDCLYLDATQVLIGDVRLSLDDSPVWTARLYGGMSPAYSINCARADGEPFAFGSEAREALEGDVVAIHSPCLPVYAFRLSGLARLDTDRGLEFALRSMADEAADEETAPFDASLLYRAAAKIGDTQL